MLKAHLGHLIRRPLRSNFLMSFLLRCGHSDAKMIIKFLTPVLNLFQPKKLYHRGARIAPGKAVMSFQRGSPSWLSDRVHKYSLIIFRLSEKISLSKFKKPVKPFIFLSFYDFLKVKMEGIFVKCHSLKMQKA